MGSTPSEHGSSAAAACSDVQVVATDASGEVSVIWFGERMYVHSQIADDAYRLGWNAAMSGGSAPGGSSLSDVSEGVSK
jgi:hypothetical protein